MSTDDVMRMPDDLAHEMHTLMGREATDEVDYTRPHQWFQIVKDATPGNPSCSGCQLPAENARHRGRFTATIILHGNNFAAVSEEAEAMRAFFHEGDRDEDLWIYP